MAAQDVQLAASSPPAEKQLTGPNDWVAYHSAANTALSAPHAAFTGFQHFVTCIVCTSDGDLAAAGVITVKDGTTVIFTANIPTTFRSMVVPFPKPLNGSVNAAVSVNMSTTGGGGVTGTVWMSGYSVRNP